ncbi:MAG: translation initiation factor IF-2 [Planctomycetota bacterium]|jgi:translation initiation factor IF-2
MSLRAYELAKQLGMPTKGLIKRCKEIGITLHNNFTNIDTSEAEAIFKYITTGEKPAPPEPEGAAEEAAAEGAEAAAAGAGESAEAKKAEAKKAAKKAPRKKDKAPSGLAAAAAAALETAQHIKGEEPPAAAGDAEAVQEAQEADADGAGDDATPKYGVVRPAPKLPLPEVTVGFTDTSATTAQRARRRPGRPPPGRPGQRRGPRRPKRIRKPVDPAKVVRPTSAEMALPITVRSLSQAISIRTGDIIKKLMQQGVMATINDALEPEVAQVVSMEFGCELKVKHDKAAEEQLTAPVEEENPEDLVPRAPVVTFMGHVDHGKTSLLDAIRETNVVSGEAGGITQHVGAYRVEQDGKTVVFLDTPGHEAFTEMRARGANVTDIVVLVVAADDGVMPQTEEAISHARAAGVAIVVAVNKTDLPNANVQKTKQQLASAELVPEEWGGTVGTVECSAVNRQGIEELVERLALEAELLELKANPKRDARGTVLEARLSQGRGIVANVLVRNGTLRRGDVILSSHGYGRAKSLIDDRGTEVAEAGPSIPVEVVGLSEMPEAGDAFYVVKDLAEARKIAERRAAERRAATLTPRTRVTLDNLAEQIMAGKTRELNLVIKADVQGSLEVLNKTLGDITGKDVRTSVVHTGIGGINESDVLLAEASGAIIVGFNVSTEGPARLLASDKGVDVRIYRVIYEVVDDVKKALEGLLEPEKKEVVQGHVDVRVVFSISRTGNVCGCFVTDGFITRSSKVRLLRDGKILYDGGLAGLRREKDDVREVREGFECGIKLANYEDVKVGDVVEAYEIQEIASKLE